MIIHRRYPGALLLCCGLLTLGVAEAQKSVAELTLVYDYSDSAQKATHTVYIKGNKSRSEISSTLFSSTTLFDSNTGFGVILREVNGQKLLIRMNPDNWTERNRMYDGIVYRNTNETKEIAGYKCVKAVGQTRFGAVITVYYTREILPENRQYDPMFRNLDGLPLEYELTSGNAHLRYRIERINLNPVPVSKFDIPGSGYREMNYEESKKMNLN
jgi:GLPGLI family protein